MQKTSPLHVRSGEAPNTPMPVPTPGIADHAIAVPRRVDLLRDVRLRRLRLVRREMCAGTRGTVLAATASGMPGAETLFHIDTGV